MQMLNNLIRFYMRRLQYELENRIYSSCNPSAYSRAGKFCWIVTYGKFISNLLHITYACIYKSRFMLKLQSRDTQFVTIPEPKTFNNNQMNIKQRNNNHRNLVTCCLLELCLTIQLSSNFPKNHETTSHKRVKHNYLDDP
ncbi:hypothetical protein ACP275_02G052800 [Erythranthe tilingii]